MSESGTVAVITQPTYLPWLGYFELVARADTFVFLDSVQFSPRSWQCRNRLRTHEGSVFWLTVPTVSAARSTPIHAVRVVRSPDAAWQKRHLRSIRTHLGGAPHFASVYPTLERWLSQEYELLADVNIAGILLVSELLGLTPTFVRSTELQTTGRRSELLLEVCRTVGATEYYSAAGARVYLDADLTLFEDAGISVAYQQFEHPTYVQCGEGFVSHLAIVDALMNLGPELCREHLMSSLGC